MKKGLYEFAALLLVFSLAGCAVKAQPGESAAKTPREAVELVLQQVGAERDKVTDLEVDLEKEQGKLYYEVDFDLGNREFVYGVDVQTGEILHSREEPGDKKPEPVPTEPVTAPQTTEPTPTEPVTTQPITSQKAKEAALAHFGLTEAQVWDLEVELEKERGVLLYEVSFDSEGYEYEVYVHSQTAEVVHSEKEVDN